MWEYNQITVTYDTNSELTEKLNTFGKDGWEVIVINELNSEQCFPKKTVNVSLKRKLNIEESKDNKQLLND